MSGESRYLLVLYEVQQAESEPIAPGQATERLDRSPRARPPSASTARPRQ